MDRRAKSAFSNDSYPMTRFVSKRRQPAMLPDGLLKRVSLQHYRGPHWLMHGRGRNGFYLNMPDIILADVQDVQTFALLICLDGRLVIT